MKTTKPSPNRCHALTQDLASPYNPIIRIRPTPCQNVLISPKNAVGLEFMGSVPGHAPLTGEPYCGGGGSRDATAWRFSGIFPAMQSRYRLTGAKQFSRIHREGQSAANRFLVIRFLSNGLDRSRFAFLVSRRIGNAVVRNRVKRRLREAVRLTRVRPGWDAVFIARRGTERANYGELKLAIDNLLRRTQLAPVGHTREDTGPAVGSTE